MWPNGGMTRRPVTRPTSTPHGGPRGAAIRGEPASARELDSVSARFGSSLEGAPGKGTVLHEPARSRCRAADRSRVHRAGGRRHQAHESVRRGDRRDDRRGVRARARRGCAVGLRRDRRAEPARGRRRRHGRLTSTFIEAVIAPSIEGEALAVLAARQNMRVVTTDFSKAFEPLMPGKGAQESRSFLGGVLLQESDRVTEAAEPWPAGDFPKVVTKRQPTAEEWIALRFAWRVCAHVKSNTVIFTGADRTLAIGAGQMSRVDAVKVAVMKAGGSLAGQRCRVGCVLSVSRRPRRDCRRGRDRCRAARRISARRGSDRRRRRARPGDGLHGPTAFQALTRDSSAFARATAGQAVRSSRFADSGDSRIRDSAIRDSRIRDSGLVD